MSSARGGESPNHGMLGPASVRCPTKLMPPLAWSAEPRPSTISTHHCIKCDDPAETSSLYSRDRQRGGAVHRMPGR
jgi:hypothetical protein